MSPQRSASLTDVLDRIEENTEGERITIDDLRRALGGRSFGPLFMIAALLAILPTGAIPGMSLLTGFIMLVLSAELLFTPDRIWLPGFVGKRSLPRQKVVNSLRKGRDRAERLSRLVRPRMEFMLKPPLLQIVAVGGIIAALTMFPLALVPFGAFPASVPLLVVGAGLTARDGLVLAVGLVLLAIGTGIAVYIFRFV